MKPLLLLLITGTCILGTSAQGKGTKTTATEKLTAVANYDYQRSGSPFVDSTRIMYSGGRRSKFDFDSLFYDFSNYADFPPFAQRALPRDDRKGYVHFDSLLTYASAGSSAHSANGVRLYNAAGRVTDAQFGDRYAPRTLFMYHSSGTHWQTDHLQYNPATLHWDTGTRISYHFVDSILLNKFFLQFDGQSWKRVYIHGYTSGGNGVPGHYIGLRQSDTTYPEILIMYNYVNVQWTSAIRHQTLKVVRDSAFVNFSLDSFTYDGHISGQLYRTSAKNYLWDSLAARWELRGESYRHLNSISLPDSIWSRYYNGSGWDTTIQKLAYNAAGNPIYLRSYAPGDDAIRQETRWYYAPANVGLGNAAVATLPDVYPVPATDRLYFRSMVPVEFRILDMTGRLLQSGKANADDGISIKALPSGNYLLRLEDGQQALPAVRFIKR